MGEIFYELLRGCLAASAGFLTVAGSALVSLVMAWLSLPAVGSVANTRFDFILEIDVGFIVSKCLRNRVGLFLMSQKRYFMSHTY